MPLTTEEVSGGLGGARAACDPAAGQGREVSVGKRGAEAVGARDSLAAGTPPMEGAVGGGLIPTAVCARGWGLHDTVAPLCYPLVVLDLMSLEVFSSPNDSMVLWLVAGTVCLR